MIYKATQEIADMLRSKNIVCDIAEDDTSSRVICGVNGKYIDYRIQFVSPDDDNDVAIRVFDLVKFPEEKLTTMISFANECNSKYRFIKFVANCGDNSLQMEVDCPQSIQDPGAVALEMVVRILRIVDELGSEMMRRVWA